MAFNLWQIERRRWKQSICLSVCLHTLILGITLISWPRREMPNSPPETAIEVEFEGPPAIAHKSDIATDNAAPALAPKVVEAPPSSVEPKEAALEEPPPPPPPPSPIPSNVQSLPTPDMIIPEAIELSLQEVPDFFGPSAASVVNRVVVLSRPLSVPKILQKPLQVSTITQPNVIKKTMPDTHSLMATLEQLKIDQKQTHPPKFRSNPPQGGTPKGGGLPGGDITKSLTEAQQKLIGNSVRKCYFEDTAARNYAQFTARVIVTVDAKGVARVVEFDTDTKNKMATDPVYRALAERARSAILSPQCATFPLPADMKGQSRQLRFVFHP